MTSDHDRDDRKDRAGDYYSCAFCHQTSRKPFRICESCGTAQPGDPADEEE